MIIAKFRAWNNEIEEYSVYEIINAKHMNRWANDMCHCEPPEFFTRFEDKNGKEIYEGDIIEWVTDTFIDNGNKGIIVMDEGCWDINTNVDCFKLYNQLDIIKIIGNIKNDSELMEKKE